MNEKRSTFAVSVASYKFICGLNDFTESDCAVFGSLIEPNQCDSAAFGEHFGQRKLRPAHLALAFHQCDPHSD
jgi:hypothetical protein